MRRSSQRAGFENIVEENKQDLAIDWLCVVGSGWDYKDNTYMVEWRSHPLRQGCKRVSQHWGWWSWECAGGTRAYSSRVQRSHGAGEYSSGEPWADLSVVLVVAEVAEGYEIRQEVGRVRREDGLRTDPWHLTGLGVPFYAPLLPGC